jgi:hypothetical protein
VLLHDGDIRLERAERGLAATVEIPASQRRNSSDSAEQP